MLLSNRLVAPLLACVALIAPASGHADEPTSSSSGPTSSDATSSDATSSWTLALPLLFTAQTPSSGVETHVLPWLGVRGGWEQRSAQGTFWGGDAAAFLGGFDGGGTGDVGANVGFAFAELRGVVGARSGNRIAGVGGYGIGSVGVGGGAAMLHAYDDRRVRPLATAAARVGLGVEFRVYDVTTHVELCGGVRDLRPEVSSTIAVGTSF